MDLDHAYRFEPIDTAPGLREREAALLRTVFPRAKRYGVHYLRWEYDANPCGDVVGFDAYAGNDLCAHYAAQPLDAALFGKTTRGILSFNTATHPGHQGRGLFTELARRTYARAASLGYEFVIGVANAQSTPGFISKLGFQLVSPLRVIIGFGAPQSDAPTDYARIWNERSRSWRLQNPVRSYHMARGRIACSSGIPLLKVLLSSSAWDNEGTSTAFCMTHPATMWIGLAPALRWRGLGLPLPALLRPSPLHLIFLDLTGQGRRLDPARVTFDAIDFDAY